MTHAGVSKLSFGCLPDGQEANLYVLRIADGVSATLSDAGAALIGLECPDRDGNLGDIVLGCDSASAHFSLDGHAAGNLEHHRLRLAASHFTSAGEDLIPTGEITAVAGTPFDFRSSSPLRSDVQDGILGLAGKDGALYWALAGICLEPQDCPDMFAHEAFPKRLLQPGMPFRSRIAYDITTGVLS